MAKKEAAPNMVEQFQEFKELKNIDKTTMISVLEDSFRSVLAKMLTSSSTPTKATYRYSRTSPWFPTAR